MDIVRVAFDLDDTLLAEATKRNKTALACSQVIIQALAWQAPYIEHLLYRQRIRHKSLTQRFGHHPKQYIQSWLDTLVYFGGESRGVAADVLRREARKAYQAPFELVPGALKVLGQLQQDARFELYLVTIGDETVQKRKVEESGLRAFFLEEHIFVVQKKKTEALSQIAAGQPDRTAMIGNSVRSDMWSALEAEVLPIWIPCGSTVFYYEDYANPHLDDWLNPESITEVPDLLKQQFFGQ